MPATNTIRKRKSKAAERPGEGLDLPGWRKHSRPVFPTSRPRERFTATRFLVENGETEYALVPVDVLEKMILAEMALDALSQIQRGDNDFVDADDFAIELAAESVKEARLAKGLTQKQLAAKLKVPQSQISRIERNPDRTTVRTLKRIAKALGVDVRCFLR